MPRIVVQTPLPAGADISTALAAARVEAAGLVGLNVVEQHTIPNHPLQPDGSGKGFFPSPNDSSVDRILVTQWDFPR